MKKIKHNVLGANIRTALTGTPSKKNIVPINLFQLILFILAIYGFFFIYLLKLKNIIHEELHWCKGD